MCPTMGSGLHPVSSREHVFTCQKDYLGCSWQVICRGAKEDAERRMGGRDEGGETSLRRDKKKYPKLDKKQKQDCILFNVIVEQYLTGPLRHCLLL